MLSNMRENFTGKFALALLVLIGFSFVFFGLNYSFIGSSYAAKVDGEEIDAVVFEQNYRDALQRNPQLASLAGDMRVQVRRSLLDQLITRQVVDNYLNENGYRISDEQIMQYIQDTPEFQKDGRFDMETYRSFLAERSMDPARFEQLQRDSMREQQFQAAIAATALVTPAEYRRYLNLVAEQRVVTVASISPEDVAEEIEVSDEMVAAYYEANPDLYQLPETVDVEFVRIRRDAVAEEIEVSEEDLESYYEANNDRYLQDEQRQARHILILSGDDEDEARAKAEEALARINGGEAFAEVAEAVSDDSGTAGQGGNLGTLTRTQLPDELGSAIFSMQEGEVTGPVESEFGFHVIQLDEILERGPLPLDQVRNDLLAEMREQEADAIYRDLERTLSDALFEQSSMSEIAAATGVELETAEGLTRSGGEPFGSNQAVIDAIFAESVLAGDQVSEIIELDANSSAIFRVTEHNEATRRPLDDVRAEVIQTLETEQAETIMSGRAEQMQESLASGEEFDAAAETAGLAVAEPQMLARNDQQADRALFFEVFAAGKPTSEDPVIGTVQLQDGSFAVYRLDAVLPGRPESIPLAERDQGKLMLAQQSGIGDFQAFISALREEAKIVVNDDVLSADDLFQ